MPKSQLELLVLYQDLQLMLKEIDDELAGMGFDISGKDKINSALDDLEKKITLRYMRTYQRLKTRYLRPISPVTNDTCLACFTKLPTSYKNRAWDDQTIFTCENCGRILYWIG